MIRGNLSSKHIQNELKKRFLSPQGFLYDYADGNGEVELPTPDESLANFPNVFGWWTPIENGAFFTGDYLLGLLRNTREGATEERIQWCRTLLHGLFRLQDAAETEGCILRDSVPTENAIIRRPPAIRWSRGFSRSTSISAIRWRRRKSGQSAAAACSAF